MMVRSHWENLSSGITTDIQLLNEISATNMGVGYSTSYDETDGSITVDFYFISSVKGNFIIDFQLDDFENSYSYEFLPQSSTWKTDLTMTKESLIS